MLLSYFRPAAQSGEVRAYSWQSGQRRPIWLTNR